MLTIRDAKTNEVIEVDDDGRRVMIEVPGSNSSTDHHDECECECNCEPSSTVITLDRAELLALLVRK